VSMEAAVSYYGLKVLVTGADGFIGSHLVEALVAGGASVTGLCLYNSFDTHGWLDEVPHLDIPRLTRVRGDIRDAALVHGLVRGHDLVFHLAALISIPQSYLAPQSFVETNILGTLNVLNACRDAKVARMVHTSTSEVYGSAITMPITEDHPLQGQSPYSATKIGADMLAESFARSFGLPVAILRPFNTFGPRQSERAVIPVIIRQMADARCDVVKLGVLTTVRDYTYVEDTVQAFLAIGISPKIRFGLPYNAGTGTAVNVSELVELVASIMDCTKPIQHEHERLRPDNSEVLTLLADNSRLRANTGWRPRVELRDGLIHTIAWWRNRLCNGNVRPTAGFMS
jgi:NAD dependent epimerase/dehydratase